MLSTSEVKRQPHELIDCAAADRLIRTSVVAGSDLDVARVVGVLDATVRARQEINAQFGG
jgi:hypothetical protein